MLIKMWSAGLNSNLIIKPKTILLMKSKPSQLLKLFYFAETKITQMDIKLWFTLSKQNKKGASQRKVLNVSWKKT